MLGLLKNSLYFTNQNFVPVSLSENRKYSCQTEPEKFNHRDRRVGAKS